MIRHDYTAGTRERKMAPKETEKDEEGGSQGHGGREKGQRAFTGQAGHTKWGSLVTCRSSDS